MAKEDQTSDELLSRLRDEILGARARVYEVGKPTPLETIEIEDGPTIYLKREDLSPMHAYKWRGAYNRMAMLDPEKTRGVVAASAGNHAPVSYTHLTLPTNREV